MSLAVVDKPQELWWKKNALYPQCPYQIPCSGHRIEPTKVQRNLNNYVGQEVGSFGGRFWKSHLQEVTLFVMVRSHSNTISFFIMFFIYLRLFYSSLSLETILFPFVIFIWQNVVFSYATTYSLSNQLLFPQLRGFWHCTFIK